jgi:transcriptional/translational regulatory protein YebC/TACO1
MSDLGQLLKKAEEAGWTVVQGKRSSHYKLYAPDGKTIVTCGSTLSDHRAIKNIRAMLRRNGVDV